VDDRAIPVHTTTEPTRTSLGEHIRAGTDTYRDMALACLVAGDRHHHLAAEILPALQGIDGIESDTVWCLNAGVYVPDVAVLLNADHPVIADRLRQHGNCFCSTLGTIRLSPVTVTPVSDKQLTISDNRP